MARLNASSTAAACVAIRGTRCTRPSVVSAHNVQSHTIAMLAYATLARATVLLLLCRRSDAIAYAGEGKLSKPDEY